MRSEDDFVEAFESILDSIAVGNGHKDRSLKTRLSDDQLKTAKTLHELVSTGDLKPEPSASELISQCNGFISDWEQGGAKSAAVQQLIALLNRPHVRGLMVAAEDVAAGRFLPQLPAIPFEVDEDEGLAVKIVRLMRRDEPLGATIKCEGGRVTITRVIAGGVAHRSQCIQEGDRVLEVNGTPIHAEMTADEIVQLVNKSENGSVSFKLIPTEIGFGSQIGQSNIHLRAQFDYDGTRDPRHPCPETSLSFSKTDILEVLVCSDEYWWQARRIGSGALAGIDDHREASAHALRVGLIPSEVLQQRQRLVEREERVSHGRGSVRSKASHEAEEPVYESVCRMPARTDRSRPIVLVGPPGVGRNELKRRLMMMFPERFATTVPHTSRPARPGEVEGVDYFFVTRHTMENMINHGEMLEFGEYRGNLYGTALSAVYAARTRSTPLLTPHPLALRLLRTPDLAPFVIYIQPPDSKIFKDTRSAFRSMRRGGPSGASSAATSTTTRAFTDTEIDQIMDTGCQMERQYGHLFDARIVNCNLEDSLSTLIKLLQMLETRPTWVPLSWATRQ